MTIFKLRTVDAIKVFKKEVVYQFILKNCLCIFLVFLFHSNTFSQITSSLKNNNSKWVYFNSQGKLNYKTLEKGDRIMDFSYAGYMGGGVKIPEIPVKITVSPSGNDDTENIQKAIDAVSEMPLSGDFRGTVLLGPGEFNISKTISIEKNGVVLRGSGSGLSGNVKSTLKLSGMPFNAISFGQNRNRQNNSEKEFRNPVHTKISNKYVPSGTTSFSVEDASQFQVGDLILIRKPVTENWVKFMKMDDLVRDGKPQTWLPVGSDLITERRITEISDNKITVDVPLSDSYDLVNLNPPGVMVEKEMPRPRLKQSGIEHLHIISPLQPISHTKPHFTALRINGEDCWAQDLFIEETMNSVGVNGKRITIEDVTVRRKALHQGSSRPAEFAPNGSQVLIDRCKVIADNVWFVATGKGISGPIVILNCDFIGDRRAESHQRWSTGMLYDNVRAKNGGIDFRNRGSMGSGHGWSMGWGVAWNCEAKDYVIQNPPGASNWMIGCIGISQPMPRPFDNEPNLLEGVIDSPGVHVVPASLYLAQLKERLGSQALENIGYK